MPDVDTSDRPGDSARTTPPVTPAPRGPGAPGGGTAPTGTGPSSAIGSTSTGPSAPGGTSPAGGSTTPGTTPGSNPTFGAGTPAGTGPSVGTGSPAGTPAGAGSPAGDGGAAGLVPAGRPTSTGSGRSGLNGGRDGGNTAARPDVQPLLEAEYAATVRERWFGVQSAFVDDPESAVREASVVLEDSIEAITRGLEKLRRSVTDAAEAADGTEDLRVALLRHREVIGRLLQL